MPIDYRIIDWLYYADSQRKDLHISWRFRKKQTVNNRQDILNKKFRERSKLFCLDNYYILNQDLNKMVTTQMGDSDFKRPEHQSRSRNRIMYRRTIDDSPRDN